MTIFYLLKPTNGSIICGTTKTLYGHRSRYSSGIFLPKIPQSLGQFTPENYSEFAVRATPRTKADCIRTNKGGCYKAVVEPLSHPFSDKPLSLTRTLYTMKLFKFITTSTPRLKITIHANSLQEAERKIRWQSKPLCIALNLPVKGGIYA